MPTINETPLSRAATYLSNEIVLPLRKQLVGRHFLTVNPYVKGSGINTFEMTRIGSLSKGYIQMRLPDGTGQKDSLVSTSEVVKIPSIGKEFTIPMQDILAWDRNAAAGGNGLESVAASAAAFEVGKLEDEIIFNGWAPNGSTYEVKGFTEIAGNNVAGGSIETVGTFYGYLTSLISKMLDDGVVGEGGAMNLGLDPTIYGGLLQKVYGNGRKEIDDVRDILAGGKIYMTNCLSGATTNKAVLVPIDTNRQYSELLVPQDYKISLATGKYEDISPVEGVCYELLAPNWKVLNGSNKSDAVGVITGLKLTT